MQVFYIIAHDISMFEFGHKRNKTQRNYLIRLVIFFSMTKDDCVLSRTSHRSVVLRKKPATYLTPLQTQLRVSEFRTRVLLNSNLFRFYDRIFEFIRIKCYIYTSFFEPLYTQGCLHNFCRITLPYFLVVGQQHVKLKCGCAGSDGIRTGITKSPRLKFYCKKKSMFTPVMSEGAYFSQPKIMHEK